MSLIIEPSDLLTFKRPLTNVTKETLVVKNPNAEPVIFKVKTTAPKQYCVRPNAGRIDGNGQVEVQVILQPFKEEPPLDFKCKDKFLVQSAQIQPHEYGSIPVTDIWSRIEKEDQGSIRQHKIKCSFSPTPSQENNTATESYIPPPPYVGSDSKAPTSDIGTSHETKEETPSAHSSNNDTIGSAPLPEEDEPKTTKVDDPVTETVKEQQQQPSVIVDSIPESKVEQQPAAAPQKVDEEPQTTATTPVTAAPATTQTLREVSSPASVKDHPPTIVPVKAASAPSIVDDEKEQKPTTTKTNSDGDDDEEKQQLRQELVAAQQHIIRLEHELEQSKQDLDGLRLRQNATAPGGAGTRKLPPTVQPLDAVHQHLAQLQKPHSIEGYPPKVVLIMCGVVFLFTYLFL